VAYPRYNYPMSYRILVSAGEVSGDQHLARVVKELRSLAPGCEVRGMAGKSCQEAGVTLDVDCYRASAGMGFFELFRSGGKVLSSFKTLKGLLSSWKPDLLIVVDYPDFNLRLAKVAKRYGVKVLYFIPPKVWAWRSGRVRTIKQVVDRIAAIFPFEKDFYAKHGYMQVTYVGHPLADQVCDSNAGPSRDNSILLLPGSRRFEVERMLVPMLQACELLRRIHTDLIPVVLVAPNVEVSWVKSLVAGHVRPELLAAVRWTSEDPLSEMRRARVAVLKSGTCNLEGAIAGVPFVSVYSGTRFAKFVVDTFVSLKEYSPVNIIRPHTVTEVMQVQLSVADVVSAVEPILLDGNARNQMIDNLRSVALSLASADMQESVSEINASVSQRTARCALRMMGRDDGVVCKAGQGAGDV
jgi:lipid-A-disaccharide synthase